MKQQAPEKGTYLSRAITREFHLKFLLKNFVSPWQSRFRKTLVTASNGNFARYKILLHVKDCGRTNKEKKGGGEKKQRKKKEKWGKIVEKEGKRKLASSS